MRAILSHEVNKEVPYRVKSNGLYVVHNFGENFVVLVIGNTVIHIREGYTHVSTLENLKKEHTVIGPYDGAVTFTN